MNYNRKNYHEKTCFDFCCGIISFGACESNSEILQKPEPEPGNQGNISKEEPFLRLMSFNIRNEAPEDTGAQTWEARKGPILKMWRELNPDVIGIQESQDKLAKYLMENLREYDCIREGQMIMYRRSRFHRINSGVFWLSETPDIPESAGWDTRKPRKTIWIRLQDKETGREFSFYNTHMDNKGVEARINGAKVNVARMKEEAGERGAVVIVGDMNARYENPTSAPALDVFDTWMKAARTTAPQTDDINSFNGFTTSSLLKGVSSLDHIFYRNFTPLCFKTVNKNYGVPYISDHYPICFDCKFIEK